MKKENTDVRELYTGVAILLWAALGLSERSGAVHRILLCTAVPMLTVSAGAALKEKESTVRSAARVLLIPYGWFSLLLTAGYAAGTLLWPDRITGNEAVSELTGRIVSGLIFYGSGSLWLLPALFLAMLLWWGLRRFLKPSAAATVMCLLALCYMILHTSQAFFIASMMEERGLRGIAIRLIFVLWRAILIGPFLLFGMWLSSLGPVLRKMRKESVGAAAVMLAAGIALACCSYGFDPEQLLLGKAWCSIPAAILISGGAYLLCDWVGEIRPVNLCGRYAMILYIALTEFGIIAAAKKLGEMVFLRFDHNFATKITMILTVLVLSVITAAILRLPVFSFLFGKKRPSSAEDDGLTMRGR